jgi:hypothetical protein
MNIDVGSNFISNTTSTSIAVILTRAGSSQISAFAASVTKKTETISASTVGVISSSISQRIIPPKTLQYDEIDEEEIGELLDEIVLEYTDALRALADL